MSTLTPHPAIGLLLAQLGTPDAPDTEAVKRFLREFLADRRVVDLPRWMWLPLLHGVILPTRSPRSAALYRKIWRVDGVSPLRHFTDRLAAGIAERLGPGVKVAIGMRYGAPALGTALRAMVAEGMERILILPLFPQYSCATTASIVDAAHAAFARERHLPTLRFAPPFFDLPAYIDALAETIRSAVAQPQDRFWLFSFHGLPQRFVAEGDPYADQCRVTARLLAERLGLPDSGWRLTFQSRFGREPWLTPDTASLLAALPGEGIRHVAVACPGFAADCLETLEEIAVAGRATFLAAGGESFVHAPCLNDRTAWIDALAELARRELSGWMTTA
ncbi:MAG: ferrochelatase [Magnetococcales bacterium]|nr:ferrochelatase [Magnetococcales bacterium]